MRKFLRVFARLAPAAAALALCWSAQAATYAWGITKSIDPGDAAFTLAQGESHSVDYNLLVVNALASGDPADGSETATLTDTISCPAGFTCTRVGTTTFPLTVAAGDGSFKNIGDSIRVTQLKRAIEVAAAEARVTAQRLSAVEEQVRVAVTKLEKAHVQLHAQGEALQTQSSIIYRVEQALREAMTGQDSRKVIEEVLQIVTSREQASSL